MAKILKWSSLIISLAAALLLVTSFAAGEDGASLYKARCAACHGIDGAGKPAAQIPSLISEDVVNATDADLTDGIANGGPRHKATHAFQSKGTSPDQVKMIVAYIRALQKK